MKITLKKEENILLDFTECPRCHKPFSPTKRRKTAHHAIPMFLKPKTEIEINLCRECHEELNNCYRGQEIMGQTQNIRFKSKNFIEFKKVYTKLRGDYYDKKINRGQFGEGLWSNLVSYLESIAEVKK